MSNLMNGRTPEAQAFRAERAIRVATELASSGGYEAVQMREVARVSEVSLSTLYRYYSSKDELIMAAIDSQLVGLRESVERRPPRERTAHGRAAAVFVRSFRAMQRDRGFTHAVMCVYHTALPFDSPQGSRHLANLPAHFNDIVSLAAWGPGHRVTKEQSKALAILDTLWNGCVVEWLNGYLTGAEVEDRIRSAAERMLDPARRRGA